MEDNTNEHAKKFPVREGGEEASILHDEEPSGKSVFPKPELKVPEKNQPEYTEEQPNRKSPSSPAIDKQ